MHIIILIQTWGIATGTSINWQHFFRIFRAELFWALGLKTDFKLRIRASMHVLSWKLLESYSLSCLLDIQMELRRFSLITINYACWLWPFHAFSLLREQKFGSILWWVYIFVFKGFIFWNNRSSLVKGRTWKIVRKNRSLPISRDRPFSY